MGLYSVPSLDPLSKMSQVEIEAGDKRGSPASSFLVWSLVLGLRSWGFGSSPSILIARNENDLPKTKNQRPKTKGLDVNIGITVYPTYGGSGIVGSELGKELAATWTHSPFHFLRLTNATYRTQ